jgi:uncharacterized protein YdhG (YjbR/CyaY superfamily)
MVKSKATTVSEYLDALPDERRAVIAAVRKVILKYLPKGYRESLSCGMPTYEVPLEDFPNTYKGQPLCYAALAAQKNHYAIYLMCAYMNPKTLKLLQDGFAKAGKKLDMGKSCIRFRKLEDVPLDLIGKVIASVPKKKWIAIYQASRTRTPAGSSGK